MSRKQSRKPVKAKQAPSEAEALSEKELTVPVPQSLMPANQPLNKLTEQLFAIKGDMQISTADLTAVPGDMARLRIEQQLRKGRAVLSDLQEQATKLAEKVAGKLNEFAKTGLFSRIINSGREFYLALGKDFNYEITPVSVSLAQLNRDEFSVTLRIYSSKTKSYSGYSYRDEVESTDVYSFVLANAEELRKELLALYARIDNVNAQLSAWANKLHDLPQLERAARLAVTTTVLQQMTGDDRMIKNLAGLADQGFFAGLDDFDSPEEIG